MSRHLCGRRLLAVLPVALLLALGLGISNARAATDDANGASTSATVGAGSNSAHFTGHLNGPNFLPKDPLTGSPCAPGAADPINLVCEHFGIDVSVAGQLAISVGFNDGSVGMNDVDLFLTDASGMTVVSAEGDLNPEDLVFTVAAPGHFELHIDPSFITDPTPVLGAITFTPTPLGGKDGGAKATAAGPEMEGKGKLLDGAEFNEKLAQLEPKERKLHFKNDHTCSFKATSFDTVEIVGGGTNANGDSTGDAHAHGLGKNKDHDNVEFDVWIHDGGRHGQGDTFTIQTSDGCDDSGSLVKGDVEYEISK